MHKATLGEGQGWERRLVREKKKYTRLLSTTPFDLVR
jgi:hypothetical protein